jgi:selenocysteine lyase/cysteine desulfurase
MNPTVLGSDSRVLDEPGMSFDAMQNFLVPFYDVNREVTNLENAYFGVMAKPVMAAYAERIQFVNYFNIPYVRSVLPHEQLASELEAARASVAQLLGCAAEELALSRSGTEALEALIVNYRLLTPGDAVIYADLDYDEMKYAMDFLKERRGVRVISFEIPEPATTANILAAYEQVLRNTPRAKLLLLTHLSNRTGLVPPVAEIIRMAKSRGVDVILDAAQTVGQLDFYLKDVGADFVGFSLHKWVGAPLGTGGIYIRKERIGDIDPFLGNRIYEGNDIRARILTGTSDFAAALTVAKAIEFHNRIGRKQKQNHLIALRNYWVERVRSLSGMDILVPDEAGRFGAVTSFRVKGMTRFEDAKRFQDLLFKKYGLLTVARTGMKGGPSIRVTPALYNTSRDLDKLVAALRQEVNAA